MWQVGTLHTQTNFIILYQKFTIVVIPAVKKSKILFKMSELNFERAAELTKIQEEVNNFKMSDAYKNYVSEVPKQNKTFLFAPNTDKKLEIM